MLRIVLVGGGHAMLPALRGARRWTASGRARVTLFDAQPHLYYSGMVPEYLGGVYREADVTIDLGEQCRASDVTFRPHAVTSIDPEARTVTDATGHTQVFDVLAVDVGGRNPGLPAGATPTKPLHRLPAVHRRLRAALQSPAAAFSLVIAGGGAAGVEIAMNVTARFAAAGRAPDLSCTIVEAAPSLLPNLPGGLQDRVHDLLTRRGVDIRTGRRVTSVGDGTVMLDDDRSLHADTVLWATGVHGPAVLQESGLPTDDSGFLRVRPTLQVHDHPRIFAAGDCATVDGHTTLAKIGVHAVKQGPDLARNLHETVRSLRRTGTPPDPQTLTRFQPYPVAPLILSTGTPNGIWVAGNTWWSGTTALRMKHWVDRRWIHAYNNAFHAWHPSIARADAPLAG